MNIMNAVRSAYATAMITSNLVTTAPSGRQEKDTNTAHSSSWASVHILPSNDGFKSRFGGGSIRAVITRKNTRTARYVRKPALPRSRADFRRAESLTGGVFFRTCGPQGSAVNIPSDMANTPDKELVAVTATLGKIPVELGEGPISHGSGQSVARNWKSGRALLNKSRPSRA